jgi:hypothetical protein
MRRGRRPAASICLALMLSGVLAGPASAARMITYKGETSAPPQDRIGLAVLKKQDGRRFLNGAGVVFTITCEDATTEDWAMGFVYAGPGERLQEDGQFSVSFDFGQEFFALEGDIDFGQADGTFEFVAARLTDDHTDAQVCTTGELTWTADRRRSRPARLTAATVPDGTGFMKVRVAHGVAEVVKLVEP